MSCGIAICECGGTSKALDEMEPGEKLRCDECPPESAIVPKCSLSEARNFLHLHRQSLQEVRSDISALGLELSGLRAKKELYDRLVALDLARIKRLEEPDDGVCPNCRSPHYQERLTDGMNPRVRYQCVVCGQERDPD